MKLTEKDEKISGDYWQYDPWDWSARSDRDAVWTAAQ